MIEWLISSINLSQFFPLIPALLKMRKQFRKASEREKANRKSSQIEALIKKVEYSEKKGSKGR